MAGQKHIVEQIISKLRQTEVELSQGRTMQRSIDISSNPVSSQYRWLLLATPRHEVGGRT